jgi:hypothetical protein
MGALRGEKKSSKGSGCGAAAARLAHSADMQQID